MRSTLIIPTVFTISSELVRQGHCSRFVMSFLLVLAKRFEGQRARTVTMFAHGLSLSFPKAVNTIHDNCWESSAVQSNHPLVSGGNRIWGR
jgi:hypothetical protein